jgi:hypothetical protein
MKHRRKDRRIVVDGETWSWHSGRCYVVAYGPGKRKLLTSGTVLPNNVAQWIMSHKEA